MLHYLLAGLFVALICVSFASADEPINYDESRVAPYTLPDPLLCEDGTRVTDAQSWRMHRRPELLRLFEEHVYGRLPGRPPGERFEVIQTDEQALGGLALRKRIVARFDPATDQPQLTIECYLPRGQTVPVPVFVGMHLFDRDAAYPAAAKVVSSKEQPDKDREAGLAMAGFRNLPGSKIIETILARGYGVATLTAADFAADDKEHYDKGVLGWFEHDRAKRPADMGKAIAAWAWGLSRAQDYFETDPAIDARHTIVVGHSRMGKTALWAGAQDERFAIVISNNSGCGGAALSRRDFGETVARINRVFPHWFCDNYRRYDGNEAACPVDQHELIALSAPRPVYVASAEEDPWADPRGEFLAVQAAEPVYRLLGKTGLGANELPPVNQPIGGEMGYHIRSGQHALADYDWLRYLDFADRHFDRRSP
ncbi:MAG: acetylxylan esterase [Pirellulales bacterium]|nr:acetylxylan esterase [Pirellulales bacterium]